MQAMSKINSSQIKAIDWVDGTLFVEFRIGGIYRYEEVPERIYDLLIQANRTNQSIVGAEAISVGSLFHYLVKIHKDKYPYKLISQALSAKKRPLTLQAE